MSTKYQTYNYNPATTRRCQACLNHVSTNRLRWLRHDDGKLHRVVSWKCEEGRKPAGSVAQHLEVRVNANGNPRTGSILTSPETIEVLAEAIYEADDTFSTPWEFQHDDERNWYRHKAKAGWLAVLRSVEEGKT